MSTLGVTKSFGWSDTEVIQQQDIQELCRVMFDALEKTLKKKNRKTPGAMVTNNAGDTAEAADGDPEEEDTAEDLINRLYQGKRSNYVRCAECNTISYSPDTFLDVQVHLRPFEENAKVFGDLVSCAYFSLIHG